jgi:hypothetical protein
MEQIRFIYFTLSVWLLTFGFLKAQNLVPNPSFEDTVHCPSTPNQLNYCQNWVNPTTASPDYFNTCSTMTLNVGVPSNGFGNQSAHTGVAYTGIYAYGSFPKNYQEYIQVNLSNSLIVNHKYLVSFYVSLADLSKYAVSTLGAYLSTVVISSTTNTTIQDIPQIQNKTHIPISDKTNWILISDTLIAQGGEQYITIGNFKADSLSDTLKVQSSGGINAAYYYIDDISVIDVATIGINQYADSKMQANIYPNPANDILYIEINEEQGEIKVVDLLGNEIKSEKINKSLQVDVSSFINGVYFIEIKTSKGFLTKKVIITK